METQLPGVKTADAVLANGGTKEVLYSSKEAESFPVQLQDLGSEVKVARVRAAGGITKNMGNFESLRIDVSIELPCVAEASSVEAAFSYGKKWVSDKVNEMIREAVANTTPQ